MLHHSRVSVAMFLCVAAKYWLKRKEVPNRFFSSVKLIKLKVVTKY